MCEDRRMMTWAELASAAPELAALGREHIEADELVMLGTIKRDGSPRISPVEPDFVDGELMAGMMWRSTKALDLLRDPRCMILNAIGDRHDLTGEFKLVCRARDVTAPDQRERYGQTIQARLDWRPTGDFHIFAFDIERAWWFRYTGHDDGEGQRETLRGPPDV